MSTRADLRQGSGRRLARWARAAVPTGTDSGAGEARRARPLPLLGLSEPTARAPRWPGARAASESRSLRRLQRAQEEASARRSEELERELERTREVLASCEGSGAKGAAEELTPLPSAYRSVQGLSPEAPLAVLNGFLLRELFRRNVDFRQRRRGA